MVGSKINNPKSDAMFNNAQRWYSAGPRLDRARDASLNTNKITTLHVIKGRAHSELLFFLFLEPLFLRFFLAQQITIMASVSKLFPSHINRIGTKKID